MLNCKGDGMCLQQDDHPNKYTKNPDYVCSFNCQPVKCPNFLVCGNDDPQCILWCHAGRCYHCDLMFGKWCDSSNKGNLIFIDNLEECCICLDNNKVGVSQPKCEHYICVDCFKECYFAECDIESPPFPYDGSIEDEYDDNPDDIRWNSDPLIILWRYYCDTEEIERNEWYNDRENLRKCPLCRT